MRLLRYMEDEDVFLGFILSFFFGRDISFGGCEGMGWASALLLISMLIWTYLFRQRFSLLISMCLLRCLCHFGNRSACEPAAVHKPNIPISSRNP